MPNPTIRISVDASQLQRLADKLQKASLGNVLQKAVEIFAFGAERYSKIASPVDTGRMRSSINTSVGNLQATVAPHTDYAIFVHEGTRFMKARPFMAIGLERTAAQYFDTSNALEIAIEKELNSQFK